VKYKKGSLIVSSYFGKYGLMIRVQSNCQNISVHKYRLFSVREAIKSHYKHFGVNMENTDNELKIIATADYTAEGVTLKFNKKFCLHEYAVDGEGSIWTDECWFSWDKISEYLNKQLHH
jgi:hypothetical protein